MSATWLVRLQEIIDEISSYPYGKFVHILDPEGNAIELWEANDDFFSDLMGAYKQIKKAGHKPDSVVPYHWSGPNIAVEL